MFERTIPFIDKVQHGLQRQISPLAVSSAYQHRNRYVSSVFLAIELICSLQTLPYTEGPGQMKFEG